MKKRLPDGITWLLSFGWRVREPYRAPVRLASQVIRYEQENLCNPHLDVPEFLLIELNRLEIGPYDICWLCLAREAARDFAFRGDGSPFRVGVDDTAIILCENECDGYLILFDSSRLHPDVLDRFRRYRLDHRNALD